MNALAMLQQDSRKLRLDAFLRSKRYCLPANVTELAAWLSEFAEFSEQQLKYMENLYRDNLAMSVQPRVYLSPLETLVRKP